MEAKGVKIDDEDIVLSATEIIPGRLYFATLRKGFSPRPTRNSRYLTVQDWLVYENFYLDFGPHHLCHVYQFSQRLRHELATAGSKKVVFYTSNEPTLRLNAVCLMGCYQIIYENGDPEAVHDQLIGDKLSWNLLHFVDASAGISYQISLLDVFKGLHKALSLKFFDFDDFNEEEYLFYETVENGDLNWIIPDKMLAFSGPHARSMLERGYPLHSPEHYHQYFRAHNVTTIVRLNKKSYEAAQFTDAGFQHRELFFADGSVPSRAIVNRFLYIAEKAPGAVAVHCKAGLGRTGTLIGCYLMKHYGFTSTEAIAWLRLCRPGSVISHQQYFLQEAERRLHREGHAYRRRLGLKSPRVHARGIYSKRARTSANAPVSLQTILDNDTCPNNNKLETGRTVNGNIIEKSEPVRHYMLPTCSASGKTATHPPRNVKNSTRKAATRSSTTKTATLIQTAAADTEGARARRKRDKSLSPALPAPAPPPDEPDTQGSRLYKIKALRSSSSKTEKPSPAPAPGGRARL